MANCGSGVVAQKNSRCRLKLLQEMVEIKEIQLLTELETKE
jgi:hypothetical protein